MRVAIGQFMQVTDEILRFGAQIGATGAVVSGARGLNPHTDAEVANLNARSPGAGAEFGRDIPGWGFLDLLHLRTRCEQHGLSLEAIEDVPVSFYDRAILGRPGRDEQIADLQQIIRNIGRAGIPVFGIHWMLTGVWRTSTAARGRGGAQVTAYTHRLAAAAPDTHNPGLTEAESWDNFAYFIKALTPAAEEAGVMLALHPDDPPVESLGGVARIFRNTEAFVRAIELADSTSFGVLFCIGSWSEMEDDALSALRTFLGMDKVVYLHFRDVSGTVPSFQEAFPDDGDVDLVEAIEILDEHGFDGCLIDDHVPLVEGDEGWAFRGRAFCTGYMAGVIDAVTHGRTASPSQPDSEVESSMPASLAP